MTKSHVKLESKTRFCIALLIMLGFSLGCSEFIIIGIEPELSSDFGVSLAQVGTLMSSFACAYAICTPLLALTTGRFKRFHLLIAYSAVFCAANLVAMVATSFGLLFLSRILMGIVAGAMLAVGVTYIPELVPADKTPTYISIVYASFSVAMVLSTSLGKIAAQTVGWHIAFVAVFVLSVIVCALLITFLPKTGTTDAPATVREQLPLLKDGRILCGVAIFLFGVGSVYMFYAYITPYLEDILGLSVTATSTTLMAYGCVCFISNLMSGWCASRFGLPALIVGFSVQAILLVVLFLVGAHAPAAIAIIMFIALSMYILSVPCVTMFMSVARVKYPKAVTLAASLEPMAFNMGIAFGTAVGGAIVTSPGMQYLGIVGAFFSLVALAFTLITIRLNTRARARR